VHVNSVKLGPQYGNRWVVESGLGAGSLVIIDNLQKLREGAHVNPQTAEFTASVNPQPAQPAGR